MRAVILLFLFKFRVDPNYINPANIRNQTQLFQNIETNCILNPVACGYSMEVDLIKGLIMLEIFSYIFSTENLH